MGVEAGRTPVPAARTRLSSAVRRLAGLIGSLHDQTGSAWCCWLRFHHGLATVASMKSLLRLAIICVLGYCAPWVALAVWVAVIHFG